VSATKKPSGGNYLLWVSLAMIVSSLVLALADTLYVRNVADNLGTPARPQGNLASQGQNAPRQGVRNLGLYLTEPTGTPEPPMEKVASLNGNQNMLETTDKIC
jgi:hypothetical protein